MKYTLLAVTLFTVLSLFNPTPAKATPPLAVVLVPTAFVYAIATGVDPWTKLFSHVEYTYPGDKVAKTRNFAKR